MQSKKSYWVVKLQWRTLWPGKERFHSRPLFCWPGIISLGLSFVTWENFIESEFSKLFPEHSSESINTLTASKQSSVANNMGACMCCALLLSRVRIFATPWTVAHQAPLSLGILQGRILEWVAMPSSSRSSQPRDQTWFFCIVGRFFTLWAIRQAQYGRTLV